jgi:nitroimidazol reductase NimA-like FMN-containing flavoprotein (pyridoxamine 5'-phosphate oxidase superfamily)
MTAEELQDFLASDTRLILATIDGDDRPWADAVTYLFSDDRVYFSVPIKTQSFENIRSDGRVCCVVESKPTGSSYYAIKGAMLHGTAQELQEAEAPSVRARLEAATDPVLGSDGGERVVFSVGLDDSTSFVFDKIRYRYQDRSL